MERPGRPSILFINRVAGGRGGATGRLLDDLATRLGRAGWSVTILACSPWCGTGQLRGGGAGPVRTIPVAVPAGRGLGAAAAQVAALGRSARALPVQDVIVTASDPPMLPLLAPALKPRAGTLVHWCHDLYPDLLPVVAGRTGALARPVLAPAVARALAIHDGVVAAGPCIAERLAGRLPGTVPLAVLENWADPVVRADDPAGAAWRARLGVGSACVALYAGTLGRVHPKAVLAEAASRLGGRNDIAIVLAGGADRARLDPARPGPTPRLLRVPWQPRAALSGLLAAADLHLALLDPRAEGMSAPCKVAASHAARRPVVFAGPAGAGP
ncbi:MAG: glycosyltransferase WbuB, partial [Azospirillaceae bacterium]